MPPTAQQTKYEPLKGWKNRERCLFNGYVCIKVPEHPHARKNKWVFEHRLVIEALIGRVLKYHETVHHINENKSDNRERNLFLCSESEHKRAHMKD